MTCPPETIFFQVSASLEEELTTGHNSNLPENHLPVAGMLTLLHDSISEMQNQALC